MAEDRDDAERTEEPTQRRLDDAAEHGDMVKSPELSTFILLAAGTLAIAMFGHSGSEAFARAFRVFLEQPDQIAVGPADMQALMWHALAGLAAILGPPLGLMMGAGLAANVLQHRPVFSAERIVPDLSKLSLTGGFKRLFGMEGLANLVRGILKMGMVGAVVWLVLWPERERVLAVLEQGPNAIAGDMITLTLKIAMGALSVLAVLAALDYLYQRFQFLKRNRMTRQEVKEEFRQTEGDPAVKAKLRQIRTERARKRMMAAVPKATVVIMNPTHYAVALKYEAGEMAAPVCVAKGVDAV
ncbi:MAG: flagellar biosynthesis protein FlhB, partial [Pseudomonadota bacterium]|nr:flagellar biosynthesis protein FlhB [Pseudomonadota bacterium]